MSGSGISWAICKSAPLSRQTTTPAPHRMPSLPPNQQRQSTEGDGLSTAVGQKSSSITCVMSCSSNNTLTTVMHAGNEICNAVLCRVCPFSHNSCSELQETLWLNSTGRYCSLQHMPNMLYWIQIGGTCMPVHSLNVSLCRYNTKP